jgi:hypothetical protein
MKRINLKNEEHIEKSQMLLQKWLSKSHENSIILSFDKLNIGYILNDLNNSLYFYQWYNLCFYLDF